MRRSEFSIEEEKEVASFLHESSFGILGTTDPDGWPELTPLNYVYHRDVIYFHGSRIGHKMDNLRDNPRVTFVVAKEYAIIPSYYSDSRYACPATAYFKSVSMRGTASPVIELQEKAEVLTALMEKLQPEGGYDPISIDDAGYLPQIRGVAVIKLTIEQMTAKFKFGQNLSEGRNTSIRHQLEERGKELDRETAELMRKYCPHYRENA